MPKKTFCEAIEAIEHLQWRPGLQAVKDGEGGGQIAAKDPDRLLGSVCIDDDCRPAFPNDSRWDYVMGYQRSTKAIAYFVEVHSAETGEVAAVEKKLRWLLDFLAGDAQSRLAGLDREVYWVASGRIRIPKHTPQFKKLGSTLRKLDLRGPVKYLELS
jgi:hypothetical protein